MKNSKRIYGYMKKIISLALAAALAFLIPCLSSCGNDDSDVDELFSRLNHTNGDITEGETAVAEHIYVVIPRNCSGELSLKARALAEALEEQTEIMSTVKYDNEHSASPSRSFEILLGKTDRLASENAYEVLKDGEYLCRWDNGAIVISGRDDASTLVAIDRFMREILPYASKYSVMNQYAHFESESDYAISKITLCGYDLYEYALVYSNESAELDIVTAVRELIDAESGYLLDIVAKDTIKEDDGGKFIYFSSEGEDTVIRNVKNGISLEGTDGYSLSLAAASFVEDIYKGKEGKVAELDYRTAWTAEYEKNEFFVSFCFASLTRENKGNSMVYLVENIALAERDVFFIFNLDEDILFQLRIRLHESYGMKEFALASGKAAVIYNTKSLSEVTVDSPNDRLLTVDIQRITGEMLSLKYVFDNEAQELKELLSDGSVIFADLCDTDFGVDSVKPDYAGEIADYDRNLSYSFFIGDNYTDGKTFSYDEDGVALDFTCKLGVNLHQRFLELKNGLSQGNSDLRIPCNESSSLL